MLYKTNYTKKASIFKTIFDWVLTIGIAIIISLFIVSNIGTITQIKEQSMEPTFKENDRVIVYKIRYQFKGPKKGEVIILHKDKINKGILINMLNEAKDIISNISYRFTGKIEKKNLIKRVVGVPGDVIDIRDGNVYVNDEIEQGYDFTGSTYERSDFSYPIEIPEGKVFVLGDNREYSLDSRGLGLIDYSQIKGKVTFRIWPLNRIGRIK